MRTLDADGKILDGTISIQRGRCFLLFYSLVYVQKLKGNNIYHHNLPQNLIFMELGEKLRGL
jgi:hypothetical protein